jgi:hypothetical protein
VGVGGVLSRSENSKFGWDKKKKKDHPILIHRETNKKLRGKSLNEHNIYLRLERNFVVYAKLF